MSKSTSLSFNQNSIIPGITAETQRVADIDAANTSFKLQAEKLFGDSPAGPTFGNGLDIA